MGAGGDCVKLPQDDKSNNATAACAFMHESLCEHRTDQPTLVSEVLPRGSIPGMWSTDECLSFLNDPEQ